MIKNIYILNERGILLYTKSFTEEKYNEDILIGFFTSIANFSREALESVVSSIDIGEMNKMILYIIPEEKLLAVAITSIKDNNNLIYRILKKFMESFISLFSPDYKPEAIDQSRLEELLKISLKGKIIIAPIVRLFLSLFIILPISLGLLSISIVLAEYLFPRFVDTGGLYNIEEVFFQIIPVTSLLTYIIILIIFPITNFISGYVTTNYKILIINIIIQLAFVNIVYFLFYQELLWFAVLINIPMVFVVSVLFSYIGVKIAGKKKMYKN